MEVAQYEIVLVNQDPTIGHEIKKTRPCIIISPDEMNRNLKTIVIAPMTTKSRIYPTRVQIKHDNKTGYAVLDQIRTIDKQRLIKKLGHLSHQEVKQVKAVIEETYVK
jgi:mRNA interferase MazF